MTAFSPNYFLRIALTLILQLYGPRWPPGIDLLPSFCHLINSVLQSSDSPKPSSFSRSSIFSPLFSRSTQIESQPLSLSTLLICFFLSLFILKARFLFPFVGRKKAESYTKGGCNPRPCEGTTGCCLGLARRSLEPRQSGNKSRNWHETNTGKNTNSETTRGQN